MTEPIDRRRFLGQSLAASITLEIAANSSLAASTVESLLAQAQPELIRLPPPVAAETNAYPLLEQLAKSLTEEPQTWEVTAEGEWIDLPKKEVEQIHQAWLSANPDALGKLEQALRREGCEYPRDAYDEKSFESLTPIRSLGRLMAARARVSLAEGDPAEAARILLLMAKAYRLLRLGGGMYVDYLVNSAAEFAMLGDLPEIASHPKCDAAELRQILKRLPAHAESNAGLRRSLQAEYCRYLIPELVKFGACGEEELIPTLMPWSVSGVAKREDYDRKIKLLSELFAGHPRPFDADETAQLASERFLKIIADLELPWAVHRTFADETYAELEPWPWQLRTSNDAALNLDELTAAQIAAARQKLLRVHNPVGKHCVVTDAIESKVVHQMALLEQARCDWPRMCLALIAFEKENGRLPKRIDELVASNLLDVVPIDPYSAKQYGYAPADRVVWSVGSQGTLTPQMSWDDNYEVETMVWRVPR